MDSASSVIVLFPFYCCSFVGGYEMKEEMFSSAPMRRHYWKCAGPGNVWKDALAFKCSSWHMGVTYKRAFTFTFEHAIIITCNSCIVIATDHLRGKPLVLIISSLFFHPPLSLPGSGASMGNSLNTSEEELHHAGTTLALKGTASLLSSHLHSDSAIVLTVITITFASDHCNKNNACSSH